LRADFSCLKKKMVRGKREKKAPLLAGERKSGFLLQRNRV
jgi:hypothetical protein